ncbi:MAG: hypothetical protein M0P69_07405 [Bacteroidales bacterium]|mgnify:CR=1 FL=1|jgi:predicted transcriptional regulator|nr:hypothetical protein [Bacteroidales bacterium]
MDNNKILELKRKKQAIEDFQRKKAQLEGSIQTLQSQLKETYGVKSLKEAKTLLAENEAKIATAEEALQGKVDKLLQELENAGI